MNELPPIPDNLPEVPEPPDVLPMPPALAVGLIQQSRERAAELLRLKERVAYLEAAHRQAMADYRADVKVVRAMLQQAEQDLHRARNEADVMVRALRALVDVCEDVCDENGWTNRDSEFQARIRHAKEVLTLWSRRA